MRSHNLGGGGSVEPPPLLAKVTVINPHGHLEKTGSKLDDAMRAARAFAIEHFEAAMRLYLLEGQAVPPTLQERHATLAADEPKTAPEGTHPVPLLRVNPNYPQRALQAGRDGWVELECDITDMGAVANVGVVASSNEDFEQASIASLQRWRYAPKFENGLPVSQDDLRTIISFCVDSCDSRGKPPSRPSSDGARPDSNEDSPKE